jgi:hypothetical protein
VVVGVKKLPILDFAMFKMILTLNQNAQKHFTPILNIQKYFNSNAKMVHQRFVKWY